MQRKAKVLKLTNLIFLQYLYILCFGRFDAWNTRQWRIAVVENFFPYINVIYGL